MNIQLVRKKIKSFGNVKKITRAMQMVSAVKMRKTQEAALEATAYQEAVTAMISRVAGGLNEATSALLSSPKGKSNRDLTIVISTNKGLCGAFNVNLFRMIFKSVDLKDTDFVTVGKKGTTFIARTGGRVIADFTSSQPLAEASALFTLVLSKFLSGEYKSISIYYNKLISTVRSEPDHAQLLPIKINLESPEIERKVKGEYILEPASSVLIDELLKSYIEERIRFILLQSEAGEHAARMIAMKNATDSATDLIFNLTLLRNKLRQEKITYELLDMISAKESVENLS